jgi:hypothetical protein
VEIVTGYHRRRLSNFQAALARCALDFDSAGSNNRQTDYMEMGYSRTYHLPYIPCTPIAQSHLTIALVVSFATQGVDLLRESDTEILESR